MALAAWFLFFAENDPDPSAAPTPEITECIGVDALDFECLEHHYVELVSASGPEAALADLGSAWEGGGFVRSACHQLTHRIGRAAGVQTGMNAFEQGNTLCSSGYYHGVIESVMAEIGAGRVVEEAMSVCAELRENEPRSADHYNCVHGMGHGFMGVFASDVFDSLEGCDALEAQWEADNCYGGVFMENFSALDHPTRPSTYARPERPLYPCTVLAPRYKPPCYDKQTTYALFVSDGDYATVFELCAQTERDYRAACYQGLGGDAIVDSAKHAFGVAAKTAYLDGLCALGRSPAARANCVIGAVLVGLRDLVDGAHRARALCRYYGEARLSALREACIGARVQAYRELPLQPGVAAAHAEHLAAAG